MFIKEKKNCFGFLYFLIHSLSSVSVMISFFQNSSEKKKRSQSTVVCRLGADPLSYFFELSQQLSLHLFVHLSSSLPPSTRRHPTKENGVHLHAWQWSFICCPPPWQTIHQTALVKCYILHFFFSAEKLSFAARLLKKRTFKYFSARLCLLAAKIYGKNNLILFKDTWKNGL